KLKHLQMDMAEHERRRDVKRWLVAHEQWHQLIFRASGNHYLTRLLFDIWHRGIFRRFATPNVPGHMDRRVREHRALLAALEKRDAALAEALWRDHILVSGEEIIGYLETAQVRDNAGGRSGGGNGLHNAGRNRTAAAERARLRREGGGAAR
ncbi:MAG TPA: FCD domain-containing protein, partial [Candidatus Sulfotelmatobacter sp.]|nr:FCD domain-containing protein [Candidatus Sulfotelmatobacter sp.]